MIAQNLLDEILAKIDIVELIAGYFPLKRAGRNFKALCPFHNEKTPSFMVNPQRQIFHCFGCSKGGNAFTFLMEYERMDFYEAAKTLAAKAGVRLPLDSAAGGKTGIVSAVYKVNQLAMSFYKDRLSSGEGAFARKYLDARGINRQTQELFSLGVSSDKWEGLFSCLRGKNISIALLEKSGLFCARREGGYYDRFRSRLIFPILDVKKRVVAFGARLLADETPAAKYVNSPETLVYVKGRHLYGLNLSWEEITKNDSAVVVEGYFDAISVYQAGIKNVVASLGTSLTAEQIKLLKRYTQNVVMIYDSDSAGQEASLRSLDLLLAESMNARIGLLTPQTDPDSFLRKMGAEAFRKVINSAQEFFDYKLGVLTARFPSGQPQGKARIALEMLVSLNNLSNNVLQSEYLRKLAGSLNINEEALMIELRKLKGKKSVLPAERFISNTDRKANPTEKLLLNLILRQTQLIERVKSELCAEDFQDARIARIFSLVLKLTAEGRTVEANRLIGYLNDGTLAAFISELLAGEDFCADEAEQIFDDCIARIKKQRFNSRCILLQNQIKSAEELGDERQLNRLITELRDMLSVKQNPVGDSP